VQIAILGLLAVGTAPSAASIGSLGISRQRAFAWVGASMGDWSAGRWSSPPSSGGAGMPPVRGDCTTVSLWYHLAMALTLRTDDELERALDLLCEQEGLSRQELIRRAVLERAERAGHRGRVDAAAESAVARWGEVLDRLGTV